MTPTNASGAFILLDSNVGATTDPFGINELQVRPFDKVSSAEAKSGLAASIQPDSHEHRLGP